MLGPINIKNLHVDFVETSDEAFVEGVNASEHVNEQESKDSTVQAAKPKVDQNLKNDHSSVKPSNHSTHLIIYDTAKDATLYYIQRRATERAGHNLQMRLNLSTSNLAFGIKTL